MDNRPRLIKSRVARDEFMSEIIEEWEAKNAPEPETFKNKQERIEWLRNRARRQQTPTTEE